MLATLIAYVRGLRARRRIAAEVDDELQFHVEMETHANVARGMSQAEARRIALRDFGGVTQTREAVHDLRRGWPDAVLQDIRYACRRLVREPGFVATAVLILAVGIGASTAMFSIVHAVLFRPFGVEAPDRLVMLWTRNTQHSAVGELSYKTYRDLRARTRSFQDFAILGSVNWSGTMTIAGGEPFQVPCSAVSASFFDVLGARPLHGRTFRPEEDERSAPRVLVLSHALWTQRFGGDPNAIGRRVIVREEAAAEPFEIVGVMPAEFFFPRGAQYWTPAGPRLAKIPLGPRSSVDQRFASLNVFYGLGRLRPNATVSTAGAETNVFLHQNAEELGIDRATTHMVLTPVRDHIFGRARPALLALMGAVIVMLLLACVNVAGLLFARGASRAREMAVRAALGAGRGVLTRQLMVESTLVAFAATIVGVGVATLTLDTLLALSPADIPRLDTTTALDVRVLIFAMTIAVTTTLLVGLAPAMHLSRPSLVGELKGAASGVSQGSTPGKARRGLIAVQLAATLVLVAAAGLCINSFARLARLDLGFEPANVLTFHIGQLQGTYRPRAERHDAIEQLLAKFERLPQVAAAGAVFQRPFEHGPIGVDTNFLLEGQVESSESRARNPMLNYEPVTFGYFRSMGIRLVRGRTFDARDHESAPRVVIVSEAAAARVWPGEDPIGKRLRTSDAVDGDGRPAPWQTVVGVVATARYREVESPRLDLYVPLRQAESDVKHFTVRTTVDPLLVAPAIANEIVSFNKALSADGVTTMEAIVRRTRGPWRFNMLVFSVFGAVALTLAAVGLFALVAYEVTQRSREIGLRMALGATRGRVVRLMILQGARPAAIGLAAGLLAALLIVRVLSGVLFEITPRDPATFTGVLVLLSAVTLLASYVPARRAASVDPQQALRDT
jgi:putative ABC transport system permease protein